MEAFAELLVPATLPSKASTSTSVDPVQRWIWHSRYGTIVIEVRGNESYVNGQKVVMASD
jgi:hypothetical protein